MTAALETTDSVFGFTIRTDVPLQFLRSGGGTELLDVVETEGVPSRPAVEPILDWALRGVSYPARATLYRTSTGYEYWTTDAGRYAIDLGAGRIEIPATGDPILREQRLYGAPMVLNFLERGDCSLHASAVEVDGGAVILAAPSKFGKTTLAYAFQRQGYRLLSEDLVRCRPDTGELFAGPALVRLRPDMHGAELPAGVRVVVERPDRVFLGFDDAHRGSSGALPIRGICFLREAAELRIEPVQPAQAIPDLWSLAFHLPNAEGRALIFRRIAALAGRVPIWNVHRPLRLELLSATVRAIAGVVEAQRRGAVPHHSAVR